MSSVHYSASGRRPLSLSLNDDQQTGASTPTKPGDAGRITIGGFAKLVTILPKDAIVEVVESGDSKMVRLVIGCDPTDETPNPYSSVMFEATPGRTSWPHVDVALGKHLLENAYAEKLARVDDVDPFRVGDLIPPTPEA